MENTNNTEDIWYQFDALPFNAKQEVVDFIAFLTQRYESHINTKRPSLKEEGFVGIWKDREDMEDSSSWVQELRTKEWGAIQ